MWIFVKQWRRRMLLPVFGLAAVAGMGAPPVWEVVNTGTGTGFEAAARISGVPSPEYGVVETDAAGRELHRVAYQELPDGLLWQVPGTLRPGERRFFRPATAAESVPSAPESALTQWRNGDTLVVANGYYAAEFQPDNRDILPRLRAAAGDTGSADVFLDDRLTGWEDGVEYRLAYGPCHYRLEQSGPLAATVAVYGEFRAEPAGDTVARAVYRFHFSNASPVIGVEAVVSAVAGQRFRELHFLQVSSRGGGYGEWSAATGEAGQFTGSRRQWQASGWGVMHDRERALGVLGEQISFYDDPHGWCQYVKAFAGAWGEAAERKLTGHILAAPWYGAGGMRWVLAESGMLLTAQACTPAVATEVASAGAAEIAGDGWRARFGRDGVLEHLSGNEAKDSIIGSGAGRCAWRVELTGPDGKKRLLDNRGCALPQRSGGEQALRFRWELPGGGTVETDWTAATDGLHGRIRVQGANIALSRVDFPVFGRMGSVGITDLVLPARNWGKLLTGFRGTIDSSYPSCNWPMQFAGWLENGAGLYWGVEDGGAELKRLRGTAGGEFSLTMYPADYGVKGAGFDPGYDSVLQVVPGTWTAVAKRYRDWALRQPWCARGALEQRDDIPRILRDGFYWMRVEGEPAYVAGVMDKLQRFFDVPVAGHLYNWHRIPWDNDYPHFRPARYDLAALARELRQRQLALMPYINGRIWDTDTDDFPTEGLAAACRPPEGGYYTEEYGNGEIFAPMCPASEIWQRKMFEVTRWLFEDEGVDAVYLDQIASGAPCLCMNTAHGHPAGGGPFWREGFRQLLGKLQTLTENTGRFLTTEDNAECYIDEIDAFLCWDTRYPDDIPLHAAVYSDRRILIGTQVSELDSPEAAAAKAGRDLRWGAQLGWTGDWLMQPRHWRSRRILAEFARARLAWKQFLSYGEYMDEAEVTGQGTVGAGWYGQDGTATMAETPAVAGSVWRDSAGDTGVVLVNADRVAHTVDIRLPPALRQRALALADAAGATEAVAGDGTTARLRLEAHSARLLQASEEPWQPAALPPGEIGYETGVRVSGGVLRGDGAVDAVLYYRLPPEERGAVIRLALPDGVIAQPASGFVLPLGISTGEIPLRLHGTDTTREGTWVPEVVIERRFRKDGIAVEAAAKTLSLSAAGPVTVDGVLDEWQDAHWLHLDGTSGNRFLAGQWSGPEDLSAQIAVRRDGGGRLCFALMVRDDIHCDAPSGSEIWRGDSVQMAFDPGRKAGRRPETGDFEFAVSTAPAGTQVHFFTGERPSEMEAATRRDAHAGVTFYELALPLRLFAAGIPAEGALPEIGFTFTVNDADAAGVPSGWLEWTPGICGAKRPDLYGVIR